MKRILVPTDFSACANKAAKTAMNIAKMSGGEIHFLHFMPIPINWIQMEKGQETMYPDITKDVNEAKVELGKLVAEAERFGVHATQYLGYNESSTNIIDHIEENHISMVVMGSHGASGFRELFMGSNAQKIVRLSPVPVLIIKKDMNQVNKANIIFVSDFETEAIQPFEGLMSLAEVLSAKVHLVYINTPSYFTDTWEIQRRMEPFRVMCGNRLGQIKTVNTYVFEDGLEKFCGSFENGIVTMATHGRQGVSRMFYGSMAEKVVNHVSIPVLSLKIPQEHGEVYLEAYV
ncbi:MAG: universal stress protein [Cyclobacteriaceae bacterium]